MSRRGFCVLSHLEGARGGEGGREGEISNVCTLYGVFVYNNSVDGGEGE